MAINSFNSNSAAGVKLGIQGAVPPISETNITIIPTPGYKGASTVAPQQVMGFVPVFPCCESSTTGGTHGCATFTLTMSGDCTGAILQLTFHKPDGTINVYSITASGSSCSTFANAVVKYINANTPYKATIVSGCEIQVCPPSTPDYNGATLTLNVFNKSTCETPAESDLFPTPYSFSHSNTWYSDVEEVQITLSVTCGTSTYNIPAFNVPPTTSSTQLTDMLGRINSYFISQGLPFIVAASPPDSTTNLVFLGLGCTAQNGCTIKGKYTYKDDEGKEIPNSRANWSDTMKGGVAATTQLGLSGGYPQTLTFGSASTVVYDIVGCGDCRQGKYKGDSIPDDVQYELQVFADHSSNSATNDVNGFLFLYATGYDAIANGDFGLEQKQSNGSWTKVATLQDNTYGRAFNNRLSTGLYLFYSKVSNKNMAMPFSSPISTVCTNNYQGYIIYWNAVLSAFGAGSYRFTVTGTSYEGAPAYCFKSPTFCLQQFDCYKAGSSVKFMAQYAGGTVSDINNQGNAWSLCCAGAPIAWLDSIRLQGYFGDEGMDVESKQTKYQTGEIKKLRDEALKKYLLRTDQLPMWLLRRFAAYGYFFSDQLFVWDFNMNNPDYNLMNHWVVKDGNWQPKWQKESRYAKVIDLPFKEGLQYNFRDRCC